jgi:hypothetical protein
MMRFEYCPILGLRYFFENLNENRRDKRKKRKAKWTS